MLENTSTVYMRVVINCNASLNVKVSSELVPSWWCRRVGRLMYDLIEGISTRCCVNSVRNDSAGWAYLAFKSSAASLVLSICETSLEFSALVHKI